MSISDMKLNLQGKATRRNILQVAQYTDSDYTTQQILGSLMPRGDIDSSIAPTEINTKEENRYYCCL
ncbi:hypothetical protein SLE2022_127200 [Rubroshorea leprosula]